jgi:hypothetical protein
MEIMGNFAENTRGEKNGKSKTWKKRPLTPYQNAEPSPAYHVEDVRGPTMDQADVSGMHSLLGISAR